MFQKDAMENEGAKAFTWQNIPLFKYQGP